MKPRFCHRARRGMVLLELIIALTIFAIASVGLVTALDRAFVVSADRERSDDATRGLRNQLALLRGEALMPGERDLPGDGGDIAYHLAVAPEPGLDGRKQPLTGLLRATLTARWTDGGSSESRTISTLFFRP